MILKQVFPWDKVIDAHKEMEANKNSGKVRLDLIFLHIALIVFPSRLCSR
jgi:hypothetical protein